MIQNSERQVWRSLSLFLIRNQTQNIMNMENVMTNQNTLSITHHVKTIEAARTRVKDAIFDVVDAILDAETQLDATAFQGALAVEIGMSKGTISKWLSIGKSPFISENRRVLPCTFTALYFLTQLETKYTEFYQAERCKELLEQLIADDKIKPQTEGSDIADLISVVDRKEKEASQKKLKKELKGANRAPVVEETTPYDNMIDATRGDRDVEHDWRDHWKGMPEYENEAVTGFKRLIVNFDTEADYRDFETLIGQSLTEKTKSIRFPKKPRQDMKSLRWIEDDENALCPAPDARH